MSSIRDQIVQDVVDRINGAGKPDNVQAIRYSLSKIDLVADPTKKIVAAYPESDSVEPPKKGQMLLKRTLRLRLDVWSVGEPIDQHLDAPMVWIYSVMGADASLGGLALDVQPVKDEWDEEAALQGIGLCKSFWDIDYIHNRNNMEAKP
jgi:hypothetical protein